MEKFDWFTAGVSTRISLYGNRPQGLWIAPSVDFTYASYGSYYDANWVLQPGGSYLIIVPTAEVGFRYAFDFGLAINATLKFGAYLGDRSYLGNSPNGFYWSFSPGVSYGFKTNPAFC